MNLSSRVALIFPGLLVAALGAQYAVQRWVVLPSFLELEEREAERNVERVLLGIDREVHHLDRLCHDWAAWDDTIVFLGDRSAQYVQSNLSDPIFEDNRLNLIQIFDREGRTVFRRALDPETLTPVELPGLPVEKLEEDSALFPALRPDVALAEVGVRGLTSVDGRPFLISSRPILTSANEGPVQGTFVLGRFLDEVALETLRSQTRVDFVLLPLLALDSPPEALAIARELEGRTNLHAEVVSPELLQLYALARGVDGVPAFLVRIRFPRGIAQQGRATGSRAILVDLLVTFSALVLVLLVLRKAVLRPVLSLTRHALEIERSGDVSVRIGPKGGDELASLAAAFDRMLGRIEGQTQELRAANEELERRAASDGLTGIANRRTFDRRLAVEWRRMQREQGPLSVVLGDIDFFKRYNDTLGHLGGDDCLRAVAAALAETARRPGDLAARYGGEEFVLLLPQTPSEGALAVAERVRAAVEALGIPHPGSAAGPSVTLSLGVATVVPSAAVEATDLVGAADSALYDAKERGRNRCAVAAVESACEEGPRAG